jgi:response regulator RpfG family c-di-GMP phosphodiesterase
MQLKNELPDDYIFEFSQDGEDGISIIDEYYEEGIGVVVIVSDWLMPGMRGDEFLVRVHQKYPSIVKVMLTGQADEKAIERAYKEADLFRLLRKPWEKEDLISTINEGLKKMDLM